MGTVSDEYEHYVEEEVELDDPLPAAEESKPQLSEGKGKGSGKQGSGSGGGGPANGYDKESQKEIDARSIYVGNVEYSVSSQSLAEFFSNCGTVQRVTIPGDAQQHPKGYAYVEFLEPEAVESALKLQNAEVGGRQIRVARKRTNDAGYSRGRGRGGRAGVMGRVPGGRGGRGRVPWGMMPMMPGVYIDPAMFGGMAQGGYSPYGPRPSFRGRGGRGSGGRSSRSRSSDGQS